MNQRERKLRGVVRKFYDEQARQNSCCSLQCCSCQSGKDDQLEGPSLGCGSPLDHIHLTPGFDVLDVGCGAGRETIEAARRVGPTGVCYGLDMSDEMLRLALENRRRACTFNAVFVRGTMENIPLPAHSVDVVISNCVINLSEDKPAALKELFRVLKPGGILAISDTVLDGTISPEARNDEQLWCACISGALNIGEYRNLLSNTGFTDITVNVQGWYPPIRELPGARVGSAFISARRP